MYFGFPNINSVDADLTGGGVSGDTLYHDFDAYARGGDCLRLTGPGNAFSITGIANGIEGRIVHIRNRTGFTMTLKNADGASIANNQFLFGGDITVGDGKDILVYYDGGNSRWYRLNSN